jgi:capsular exopolysaccharide synthesis family protein
MQGPLPLASYGFILRKHLWLVVGTVAVVLAGGWFYARTQPFVYQASALVQIQMRPNMPPGQQFFMPVDEKQFVNDQSYRLRIDETLAKQVLDRLQAASGPSPAADGGQKMPAVDEGPPAPPLPSPALFRDMSPRSLPQMIFVTSIPTTSFYQFSVKGEKPEACVGLVNTYASEFAKVYALDRGRQVQVLVDEYEDRLKPKKKELGELDESIEKFKKAHAAIDFDAGGTSGGPDPKKPGAVVKRPGNADREDAEFYRRELAAKRSTHISLKRQRETVDKALAVVDLKLEDNDRAGFKLVAAWEDGKPPADDPRLSERIQALDMVARDDRVVKAVTAVEEAVAEEKTLARTFTSGKELEAARKKIDIRQRALARSTEAALVQLALKANQAQAEADDLQNQLRPLEEGIAATGVAMAEYEKLKKGRDALQASCDDLSKLINDAKGQRTKLEEGGTTVRVYKYAQPLDAQLVAPNKPVIYLTTAVLALLLAAGLAYVLEYLDDTVKTREDFDRLVRLPFLGYVPHLREVDGTPRDLVVARGKTGSPEVESFRAIRTGVQFSRPDREVRTFLVTSAGPGEGKTTVSVNLSSAFTGSKGRVLLIDADLRRARVHTALGIDNARGLTNVLVGEAKLADVIQKSCVEGLDVLASGPIPPNPAEVLGSERMQELLAEAAVKWDRVIIDSPPLVAVTDPALLAKYVDAIFLVISIGKTSIRTIQRARETLSTVGAGIHGAILNNADVKISGYAQSYGGYGYGYGYGYGAKG